MDQLNDSRLRFAVLCRRPDPHPEVDHDPRLECACICHGPDGEVWRPRDVDRDALAKFVYDRLLDSSFRSRLTVRAADGTRPIVCVLASDPVLRLLHELQAAGGAANVVVGLRNGAMSFADITCSTPKEVM